MAKDSSETGVEISLWTYNPKGKDKFDCDIFYRKLLLAGSNCDSPEEEEEELSNRVQYAGKEDSFDNMHTTVRKLKYYTY